MSEANNDDGDDEMTKQKMTGAERAKLASDAFGRATGAKKPATPVAPELAKLKIKRVEGETIGDAAQRVADERADLREDRRDARQAARVADERAADAAAVPAKKNETKTKDKAEKLGKKKTKSVALPAMLAAYIDALKHDGERGFARKYASFKLGTRKWAPSLYGELTSTAAAKHRSNIDGLISGGAA